MKLNLERLVEKRRCRTINNMCTCQDMETEAAISLGSMTLASGEQVEVRSSASAPVPVVSGGAISKFKKKNKDKKKKRDF